MWIGILSNDVFITAAGPAVFVGLAHLRVAVGVRRGGQQERREDLASEELGLDWNGLEVEPGQDDAALGAFLGLRLSLAPDEGIGFRGGVLAGGNGFDNRGRVEQHIARVEQARGLLDWPFRPAADGGDHHIELAEHGGFLPVDDEVLGAGRFTFGQQHAGDAQALHAPALVDKFDRLRAAGHFNPVLQQHLPLVSRERHVLDLAAVDQFDGQGATAFGGGGAVDSHGAAAQDGDFPVGEVNGVLVFEVMLPGQRVLFAGDAQLDRFIEAGADDDGAVFGKQLVDGGGGCAGLERDGAELFEEVQVASDHLPAKPEVRDKMQHAAEALAFLVDGDLVAQLRQHAGGAEPGGAGADHGHAFPVRSRRAERFQAGRVGAFHHAGLDGGDVDRLIERPARAGFHAEVIGAHHAADPAERVRPQDQLAGPAIIRRLALAGSHDEVRGRAMGGTSRLAWLLLAIFASVQFGPELGIGEASVVLFHDLINDKGAAIMSAPSRSRNNTGVGGNATFLAGLMPQDGKPGRALGQ